MKDISHHLKHVQKKVLQSVRRENEQNSKLNGKKMQPPLINEVGKVNNK